jgi:hypothetical protein
MVVLAALAATWSGAASAQGGSATSTSPPRDGASYEVRLQDLHERIELLHEQLKRMQDRQKLLSDSGSPVLGPVQAEIAFADEMSGAFVVTGVRVWIDETLVYARTNDDGALGALRRVRAFEGSVPPGEHTVRVSLRLAGNGAVLPYMRAYHFEVSDTRTFVATERRAATLTIHAFERGDVTTPFDQRPAVAWEESAR